MVGKVTCQNMGLGTKISILSIIVFEIEAEMYVSGDVFKMAISRPS